MGGISKGEGRVYWAVKAWVLEWRQCVWGYQRGRRGLIGLRMMLVGKACILNQK
jgi:hypothetical protein